jgi:hypothetical protein
MNRFIILSMLVALSITHPLAAALAVEVDYETTMQAIAQDIANLRSKVPELQDFSPGKNAKGLTINYAYHTHKAKHRGGWTAGVPNPNDDGVWFYINFHDPHSIAQIDTQPAT